MTISSTYSWGRKPNRPDTADKWAFLIGRTIVAVSYEPFTDMTYELIRLTLDDGQVVEFGGDNT